MARASIDPSDGGWSLEGMAPLLDVPSPRTPLEFLELEKRVLAVAGRQADGVLGYHLIQAHQDPDFVSRAVAEARDRHGPLRHKGQRTSSVWLPGGTLCVVKTPYMRPPPPRRPGRKRSRRGPTGAGVYPVLEALGITDRVSPATRSEMALYTVQAGSYQEAVALLAELGLHVDPTTLRRVAQSTAQADIALRDAALNQARSLPVPADGPLAGLRVRVSVDGGRVRTRVERPGRKTKKGRHRFTTPWREPRVLLIDILDGMGKADRLRLPLYDVLLEDADAMAAEVIGYLRLLGAAHAKVVELIADGADWLWERAATIREEAEIPAERWVEVVDFYHASQHLHDAVELCRNRKASERTQWYEKLRHVLRTEPAGVHKVIEALRPEVCGRRGRKMNTAIEYFERHAERMAYVDLDRQRLPVGSGPVESAIRRVINLRFKAPSIFWEPENVADLMHLRAAFKCGRWHEMMERVLTQSTCVPSFARLPRDHIHNLLPPEPHADGPPIEVHRKRA